MKRLGLALGGGGARGVAHIAYLKALEEAGVKPCVISGTSSGAIASALYAGGLRPDEIMERIQSLFRLQGRHGTDREALQKRPGGWTTAVAQRSIARILPKKRFEELDIPLKVVATNFHTLEERVFESGELLPALMASIALPDRFAPQPVDGEYYMDGGATNIVPFDIIRGDCDVLAAIDVSLVRPLKNLAPTRKNASLATWAATQEAYIREKLKTCPVEIFERPTFSPVSTMQFYKFKTVYDQALGYLPGFIDKINKLI